MACGAPVVTSATGATAEIAGDAAVLVDPFDPSAIAAGIEEATDRREELSRRGLRRAASFSWRATAEATVAVYREAAV
jgi:glycosyltransferase involved in cell wall biosynthesis